MTDARNSSVMKMSLWRWFRILSVLSYSDRLLLRMKVQVCEIQE